MSLQIRTGILFAPLGRLHTVLAIIAFALGLWVGGVRRALLVRLRLTVGGPLVIVVTGLIGGSASFAPGLLVILLCTHDNGLFGE